MWTAGRIVTTAAPWRADGDATISDYLMTYYTVDTTTVDCMLKMGDQILATKMVCLGSLPFEIP